MPRKSAKDSRSKSNSSQHNKSDGIGDEKFQSTEGEFVYQVCSQNPEVLAVWPLLSREEKLDVLDVTPEQLFSELMKMSPVDMPAEATPALLVEFSKPFHNTADPHAINRLRMAFLNTLCSPSMTSIISIHELGLDNPNVIDTNFASTFSVLMLSAIESNLALAHIKAHTRYRLHWFLSLFAWVYCDGWHWLLRLLIMLPAINLGMQWKSHYLSVAREWISLPFAEELDSSRFATRVESTVIGVISLTLGWWMGGFTWALLVLDALPLLLVELEARIASGAADRSALPMVRRFCTWVTSALLLYILWGRASPLVTFLAFTVVFPALAEKLLSLLALGLAIVIGLVDALRPQLLPRALNPETYVGPLGHAIVGVFTALYWLYCVWTDAWWTAALVFALALFALFPVFWIQILERCASLAQVLLPYFLDPMSNVPLIMTGFVYGIALTVAFFLHCCRRTKQAVDKADTDSASSSSESSSSSSS